MIGARATVDQQEVPIRGDLDSVEFVVAAQALGIGFGCGDGGPDALGADQLAAHDDADIVLAVRGIATTKKVPSAPMAKPTATVMP